MPGHLLVVQGNADVYGKLLGNLVTVDGDVVLHPGGVISGDVLTFGGEVRDEGGRDRRRGADLPLRRPCLETPLQARAAAPGALETVFRRMAGVVGVFLTLGALGFGLVMFGRPNLEVVSDTVSHSFGRAFATGLLGQLLLLPTFGMLVVGLILSVVGHRTAAVRGRRSTSLLVVIGAVGGYLAVAHAMGETYTRRRMALGAMIGSPNSYRYLLVGLGALAAFWLAWSVFGWVPVAGNLIRGAAVLVTWLLATAGLRRGAPEPGRHPRELRRPVASPRGADRRIPLGHPAVRRDAPPSGPGTGPRRGGSDATGRPPRRWRSASERRAPAAQSMRPFSTYRQWHGETRLDAPAGLRRAARSGSPPAGPTELYRMDVLYDGDRYVPVSDFDAARGGVGARAPRPSGEGGLRVVSRGQLRQTASVDLLPEERPGPRRRRSARWTATSSWAGSGVTDLKRRGRAPAVPPSGSPSPTRCAAGPRR